MTALNPDALDACWGKIDCVVGKADGDLRIVRRIVTHFNAIGSRSSFDDERASFRDARKGRRGRTAALELGQREATRFDVGGSSGNNAAVAFSLTPDDCNGC